MNCNGCSTVVDNQAWNAENPGQNESGLGYDGMDGEYVEQLGVSIMPHRPMRQAPSIPRVTTETGWPTGSISGDQQGRLLVNVLLSAAARGWFRTFIYQMIDDTDSFGLFTNTQPLAPKLSATYIHNLTTILSDGTSNFQSTPLSYTIPSEPATVHDWLMQKSSGAYELSVWDDRPVGEGTDNVTVNLGKSFPTVNIYDVTAGTTQFRLCLMSARFR